VDKRRTWIDWTLSARDMGDAEGRKRSFSISRDASVAIALLSLIAALVFSAIQVRDSSRQSDQSQHSLALQQQANDFSTLMEVSSRLPSSHARLERLVARGQLRSTSTNLGIVEALGPNEPIAFALNRGLVRIKGAHLLWGNTLLCNWEFAQQSPYADRFPRYFPEFVRYAKRAKRSGRVTTSCL
jgi:hypothetical protein